MRVWQKLQRLLILPWWMQCAFLPVWCMLGVARLIVLRREFRSIAPKLGAYQGVNRSIPTLTAAQTHRARRISRQIQWVAHYCPWRANCFAQAITARWLCRLFRLPCLISFGLKKARNGAVLAHAWVRAGDVAISGGEGFGDYEVVGCFLFSPTKKTA